MLLSIDIGNTNIRLGIFKARRLVKDWCIKADKNFNLNKIKKEKVDKIIICSVVPNLNLKISSVLKKTFKIKPLFIGKDIKVPIKNLYKNPKQVGQDRLVNAYAGLKSYGPGLIIIDFGTAITFDIVSKQSEYLGGLIFPGVELCLNVLNQKTALLPKISLKTPKNIIGKDTSNSINSGVFYGIAGMCDNLIQKLHKKYRNYKIISTGGNARHMKVFSKNLSNYHSYLTLEGIRLLAETLLTHK